MGLTLLIMEAVALAETTSSGMDEYDYSTE
jgi:hypothetical protein